MRPTGRTSAKDCSLLICRKIWQWRFLRSPTCKSDRNVNRIRALGGIHLPKTSDPSYESPEHVGGHVLRAARNYLTWIGEGVRRPVTELDPENDLVRIARKGRVFLDEVLGGRRRHLSALEDSELAPATCKSRWGEDYNIEQMLEHTVVHPMRHRIQLERLMSSRRE